ncbi:MAG: alpha-(1-2)-phosphatidylinositol mannosyltransferase, partial [Actinomycetota bacterium]|nr:alpha-(1-2)-phosphatidylinositol mannosyltransferase [Actinomycetota bacterium]
GDADALAAHVVALLDDDKRRACLRAAAATVVRRYDWSTLSRDIVRVYDTVRGSAGPVGEA